MDILGIGWQELIFIVIIALIVLGPKDMQKAGRSIGRWLNQLVRSDSWKVIQKTSSELRNLPRTLMREANMEMMEAEKEIRRAIDPRPDPPASPSSSLRPNRNPLPSKEAQSTPQAEPPSEHDDDPAAIPGESGSALSGEAIAKDSEGNISNQHD